MKKKKEIILPVAEGLMEADDEVLLVGGEVAPLDVRAEVVDPPQATALPAPQKPCSNTSNDTRGPSLIGGNHRPRERESIVGVSKMRNSPACLGRARQLGWPC